MSDGRTLAPGPRCPSSSWPCGASWLTPAEFDFGTARVGSVAVALAIIASFRLWRRREVRFLLALLIVTLLACWKVPPLSTLLRALPLFNVSLNERLGIASALALSLLAGIAFDEARPRDRRIVFVVGSILAIVTAALWKTRVAYTVDVHLIIAGAVAELIGIALLLVAVQWRTG